MTPIDLAGSGLLVVDCQKGFSELCPQELPVPGALDIVPNVNRLLALGWKRIDATTDWHPPDHCSFLGRRDNLYPPHCVAETPGAEFLPGLRTARFHTIWRKGFERDGDAYAVTQQYPAFVDLLRGSGIRTVFICGLAINICCYYAARDLKKAGFDVAIVEDASAGIDLPALGISQVQSKSDALAMGVRYLSTEAVYSLAGVASQT